MDASTEKLIIEKCDKVTQFACAQKEVNKTLFTELLEVKTEQRAIHGLSTEIAVMGASIKNICDSLVGFKADIEEIKKIPANRWNSVVNTLIGGAVGFAIAKLSSGGF